jgi:hypothetical protein
VTGVDALATYFYAQPGDRIILEEVVDGNGFHRFSIYGPDVIGPRLADYIDPLNQAGSGTLERFGSLHDFVTLAASLPELSQANAISTITVATHHDDPGRSITVYASARGVYWLRQQDDDPEPATSEAAVFRLSPVSRDDLIRLPLDLLTGYDD